MKTIEEMMIVDFTIDFVDYLYAESLTAWTISIRTEGDFGVGAITN